VIEPDFVPCLRTPNNLITWHDQSLNTGKLPFTRLNGLRTCSNQLFGDGCVRDKATDAKVRQHPLLTYKRARIVVVLHSCASDDSGSGRRGGRNSACGTGDQQSSWIVAII